MRAKVRDQAARWRKPDVIRQRYLRLCERLHMPSKLYELNFEQSGEALSMSFRKDAVIVGRKQSMFGKSIIINNNSTAQDIVDDMRHLHVVLTLRCYFSKTGSNALMAASSTTFNFLAVSAPKRA